MSNMKERFFVTADDKIEQYENNLVTLTLKSGEVYEKLEPRRLFPVSAADKYITLLDTEGVEIAQIRDLRDLNGEARSVIDNSLADYYLVPVITKIINVTEKFGTLHWTVETERGQRSFDIRNRQHDIKVYSDGRVRVRDSDDNRYTIPDYKALDAHSRALMIADL